MAAVVDRVAYTMDRQGSGSGGPGPDSSTTLHPPFGQTTMRKRHFSQDDRRSSVRTDEHRSSARGVYESDTGSDASGDEHRALQDDQDGIQSASSASFDAQQEPIRKRRRFLQSEDVRQFANMSIERAALQGSVAPAPSPEIVQASEIWTPQSPPRQTARPPMPSPSSSFERRPSGAVDMFASAVEEPPSDDISMRRGEPRVVQLDKDRYFVSSMSDSSSDEEEEAEKRERLRIDGIMQGARGSDGKIAFAQATGPSDNAAPFVVNGELISRLEALEWQRRMDLTRSKAAMPLYRSHARRSAGGSRRSGSSTPKSVASDDMEQSPFSLSSTPQPPSALVLWRQPENVSLQFGHKEVPATTVAGHPQSPEKQAVPLAPPSSPTSSLLPPSSLSAAVMHTVEQDPTLPTKAPPSDEMEID